MKASELKPGQFFEFANDDEYDNEHMGKRCMYVGRDKPNRDRIPCFNFAMHDEEGDVTIDFRREDFEVTPLAVTGWDDERQTGVRFDSFDEPTEGQILDACLTFDHGFGLEKTEAKIHRRKWEAKQWLHAWRKVFMQPSYVQAPPVAKPEPEQFKAGDWLYCTESHAPLVAGNVYKVLAVKRDGWPEVEEGQGCWNPKYFRRATADEIVKHKIDNGYCLTDDDTAAFRKDYWQHPVVEPELTWTVTT